MINALTDIGKELQEYREDCLNSAWDGEQEVHRERYSQGEILGRLSNSRGDRGGHMSQGKEGSCTKTGSGKKCRALSVQKVLEHCMSE